MAERLKRLNLNLDPETHRRFKVATAAQGTDMTQAVKQFIAEYIRKYLPRGLQPRRRRKEP